MQTCVCVLSWHHPDECVLCAWVLGLQFHERVQLDSITHNELGDPDVLAHLPPYAPAAAAGPIGESRSYA